MARVLNTRLVPFAVDFFEAAAPSRRVDAPRTSSAGHVQLELPWGAAHGASRSSERSASAAVPVVKLAHRRPRQASSARNNALTVQELLQQYLAFAPLRSKSPERYRKMIRWLLHKHVLPTLGHLPIKSLRPNHFEHIAEVMLLAGYKVETYNAVIRAVSGMFSWARRIELHDGANPARGLQRTPPFREKEYFSEAEIERLLSEARRRGLSSFALLSTALYTGMRKGELCGLRWGDVDLERELLIVRRSFATLPKSGRVRGIPLHPELRSALIAWRAANADRDDDGLVFPVGERMGTPHDMFGIYDLMERAGVRRLSRPWHAMRHTFASHYVMKGGNLLLLQRMLGHSRFEMTQVYSHLSTGFMLSEIQCITYGQRR